MPFLHRTIKGPNHSAVPLLQASIEGDVAEVKRLLTTTADVNQQGEAGWTALQIASAYGHGEVADVLLRNAADPNLTNSQGRSALMYAAAFGYTQIVNDLLRAGADVNAVSSDPDDIHTAETSLMLAAWSGYVRIIELLLAAGADVNAKGGPLGGTALHSALYEGHASSVEALLRAPAIDINEKDDSGKTPRQNAAESNRTDILKMLDEFEASTQ